MSNVRTDSAAIDELLSRSIDTVYPTHAALQEALVSGRQLRVYMGIDPTANYVHLGHSTNYLLLERLHKLGHKVIVLVGDFTATIGDPTDKGAARTRLTREDVERNLTTFKTQIGAILDFDDRENPVEFRFNSEWLRLLTFEDLIELSSHFTVQHMLDRDMFAKRISENKPLYVHEFFYPLMQGYDSVKLDVDLEIGGTDQTFNMLAGRTLVRRYLDREKFVLTTTLLTNPVTGEKLMSKSLGTGIALNETPNEMFGKTMALPDEGVFHTFVDCTRVSMEDIEAKRERLKEGANPKDIKLELAHELVRMYHGEEAAADAQRAWEQTFSEGSVPEVLPEYVVAKGTPLVDALVQHSLAGSKTQARRLIEDGAVKDAATGERFDDVTLTCDTPLALKIGKKTFAKLLAEE